MKVLVHTPGGGELTLEPENLSETIMTIKLLITSRDSSLGTELRLWYQGEELTDENATLEGIKYTEGTKLILSTDGSVPIAAFEPAPGVTSLGGKGGGKGAALPLQGREGDVPMVGFQAVRIVVSGVSNEKTNGLYLPAAPHNKMAVWYKAPSDEEPAEGESKDRGERGIYYSTRQEKWFIGDELDAGGFAFAVAWGNCAVPPQAGWTGGASLQFEGDAQEGDLNYAAGLTELTNLSQVEPWADQEICYATMLKVLGNIVGNPGEAKFCSIKVDNAAIQKKILSHNGARGFLEAVGFREAAGALTLPSERHGQAGQARELLLGFSTEASYRAIRKERHAKAAVEMKKDAEMKKWAAARAPKPSASDEGGGKGGGNQGPQRG